VSNFAGWPPPSNMSEKLEIARDRGKDSAANLSLVE
jgi:hypothetical protein